MHRGSRFGFFKGFLGFVQRVSHKNKLYKCTVVKICCYSCKIDCGKSHSGFIAGSTVLHIVPVSDGVSDTKVMPSRRQQYQVEKSGKKGLQDEGTSRCPEMSLRFLQDQTSDRADSILSKIRRINHSRIRRAGRPAPVGSSTVSRGGLA